MKTYSAIHHCLSTLEPTGRVETYMADSLRDAVQSVLYTRRLSDGGAAVGPNGLVVYSRQGVWFVKLEGDKLP